MKGTYGRGVWRGMAMAAMLAPLTFAQTRYTVTILTVPPPYLGGNVSAIENGVAGGWAYTNCTNQPGCAAQEVAMVWPNLQAAGADLTGVAQLTPAANITGAQPTLLAGTDPESGHDARGGGEPAAPGAYRSEWNLFQLGSTGELRRLPGWLRTNHPNHELGRRVAGSHLARHDVDG